MSDPTQVDSKTLLILRVSIIWRVLFTILAAVGAIAPWAGIYAETPLWQKILLTVFFALASIFSGIAAFDISPKKSPWQGYLPELGLSGICCLLCCRLEHRRSFHRY